MSTIALITGGNRGLGLATATALARTGATVVITGRDEHATSAAAKTLVDLGLDVDAYPMDVTSQNSIAATAADVAERYGRLDVLVNNAGILPEASSTRDHRFVDLDAFKRTFDTNVVGLAAVTEGFLPLLMRSDAGRIVNVSSTMGSLNDQQNEKSPYYSSIIPAYQASKAAVNSLTIGLSKKLADTGIKVTSVCPGWVQTDLAPGNRELAPTSANDAARIVVEAATLPDDAPSGAFISESGPVPW